MQLAVQTLMGLALAVVTAILFTGIIAFAKGGVWYRRNANRLMNLRVAAQFSAALLFALAMWLSS
ncbi:MAG: HIG1 domain-containing protein [Magnetospirillum sp.]|nr:HIG1 domain-containing protein [Magnetospirillum sp.]